MATEQDYVAGTDYKPIPCENCQRLQDRLEQQQAKPSAFRQKVTCALLDSRSTEEQRKVALELLHEGENIIEQQNKEIKRLKNKGE